MAGGFERRRWLHHRDGSYSLQKSYDGVTWETVIGAEKISAPVSPEQKEKPKDEHIAHELNLYLDPWRELYDVIVREEFNARAEMEKR